MQQAHTSDMMHHSVYTNSVYHTFCTATQLSQTTTGVTAAAKVTTLQEAGSTAYTKQEAYQHTCSTHHRSPEPGYAVIVLCLCLCRKVGWDRDDVWLAHCCQLDDAETKQWAQHGIGIAHCPSSNMRLASGICPVRKTCLFMFACSSVAVWSVKVGVPHQAEVSAICNCGMKALGTHMVRPLTCGSCTV